MEIVLDFGPTVERIEVALPDERRFYEVFDAVRRATVEEGRRHVVNVILRKQVSDAVPKHGVIVFDSTTAELNSNFEGPWYLYVNHSRRLRAYAIALEMICEVMHVSLTVDDD